VLHCALAATQCIIVGPFCLFVGGWVCYHDNTTMRASILTKLGLLVKVVLIKFWLSHAPGKWVCGGVKILAPPYYSQRAVFASPLSAFSFFLHYLG